MSRLVSEHGQILEQTALSDPHIYVKILAQFERIQCIMITNFRLQLADLPANQNTVHFDHDFVVARNTEIRLMFNQLSLFQLRVTLPVTLSTLLSPSSTPAPVPTNRIPSAPSTGAT